MVVDCMNKSLIKSDLKIHIFGMIMIGLLILVFIYIMIGMPFVDIGKMSDGFIVFLLITVGLTIGLLAVIKSYLGKRKQYKILKSFEVNKPILINNIYYVSKLKKKVNTDRIVNEYRHKVDTEINVPGYGKTRIQGLVRTSKNEIDSISVAIDPNNVDNYVVGIAKDVSISYDFEEEYNKFIKKYYGE